MKLPRYVRQLVSDCFDEEQYQAGVSLLDSLSGAGQYQPDTPLVRSLFALSLSAVGPTAHRASLKRKRGSKGHPLPTSSTAPSGLDFSKRDVRPPAQASVAACQVLHKLARVDPQTFLGALPPHILPTAPSSPVKGFASGTRSASASPTSYRSKEQEVDEGEPEVEHDEVGDAAMSPLVLKSDQVKRARTIWDALDISPVGEASTSSDSRKRQEPLRLSTASRRSNRKVIPTRRWLGQGSDEDDGAQGLSENEEDDEVREMRREMGSRWKRDGCWSLAEIMLLIWKGEREQRDRDVELGLEPQPGNLFLQCGGTARLNLASLRGSTRLHPASELGDALNFAFAGLVAAGATEGAESQLRDRHGDSSFSRHEGLRRARVGAALLCELSHLASKGLVDRDALIRGVASRVKFLGADALEQVCFGSPSTPSTSNEDCDAALLLAESLVAHLKASSEVHQSATDIGRSSPLAGSFISPSPARVPKGFAELCTLLDEAEGLSFLEPSQPTILAHLPREVRSELAEAMKGGGSRRDALVEALADLEKIWPIERLADGDVVARSMLGSRKGATVPLKRSQRLDNPKQRQSKQSSSSSLSSASSSSKERRKERAERDEVRQTARRWTAEMRGAEIEARLGHAMIKCGLVGLLASSVQALAIAGGIRLGKVSEHEKEEQQREEDITTKTQQQQQHDSLASLLEGALQSSRAFATALTTSSDEASSCIKHMYTDPGASEAWEEGKGQGDAGSGSGTRGDATRRKRARTMTPIPGPSGSADFLQGYPELLPAFVRAERGAARLRGMADALNASIEVMELSLGCPSNVSSSSTSNNTSSSSSSLMTSSLSSPSFREVPSSEEEEEEAAEDPLESVMTLGDGRVEDEVMDLTATSPTATSASQSSSLSPLQRRNGAGPVQVEVRGSAPALGSSSTLSSAPSPLSTPGSSGVLKGML